MSDSFADSRAQLEKLLELAAKEKDPERCDQLAAEIRRLLDERESLRTNLGITNQPKQEN